MKAEGRDDDDDEMKSDFHFNCRLSIGCGQLIESEMSEMCEFLISHLEFLYFIYIHFFLK